MVKTTSIEARRKITAPYWKCRDELALFCWSGESNHSVHRAPTAEGGESNKWDLGGTLDKVLNVFESLTQALFSKLVRVFVPPAVRRHAACV